jgi:hypothetical protein
MAVDTRDRRASALQFCSPTVLTFPEPDGLLGLPQDRAHIATAYRSLFAVGGPIFVGLGIASEVDAAIELSAINPRSYEIGLSLESDSANALEVVNPKTCDVGTSLELDQANPISIKTGFTIGPATESDTAIGVTVVAPKSYQLGVSNESDSGLSLYVISDNTIATQIYVSNIYIQVSNARSSMATSSVATIIEVSESTTAMN